MAARTPGERYTHLLGRGYKVAAVARLYGVTEEAVRAALEAEGLPETPPPPKPKPVRRADPPERGLQSIAFEPQPTPNRVWCDQCDRLVYENEAAACHSRFCRAKLEAA